MTDKLREAAQAFIKVFDNTSSYSRIRQYVDALRAALAALAAEQAGEQAAPDAPTTEDFCGVMQERSARETSAGTEYHICKWACPNCGKACSMLELDGEWCHGDSMAISYKVGARTAGCGSCWLATPATAAPTEAAPDAPTTQLSAVSWAVESLVSALAESKGWLRDYARSVILDAIDRKSATAAPVVNQQMTTATAAPVEPVKLTDGQIEDCIDTANRKFNGRRQGPSGQQLTTYDDWKHWLAREVESAIRAQAVPAPQAEQDARRLDYLCRIMFPDAYSTWAIDWSVFRQGDRPTVDQLRAAIDAAMQDQP